MTAQFGYLLNAMERAACESNPAEHDYKGKRIAVLGYVSALEVERERLRAELAACNENLAKANQQIETLENMLLRRFGSHMPGGCYVRYADYCECGWTQERLNIEAARKGEGE